MQTAGKYQLEIRKKLAHCYQGNSDSSCIADATLDTWHQMSALLAPVIGVKGVEVLFKRALYLTSAAFPWLAIPWDNNGNSADLLVIVKRRLAEHEATVAAEAGCALLVNFTELLSALIGESLTGRLLAPVWTPPSNG